MSQDAPEMEHIWLRKHVGPPLTRRGKRKKRTAVSQTTRTSRFKLCTLGPTMDNNNHHHHKIIVITIVAITIIVRRRRIIRRRTMIIVVLIIIIITTIIIIIMLKTITITIKLPSCCSNTMYSNNRYICYRNNPVRPSLGPLRSAFAAHWPAALRLRPCRLRA